VVIGSRAISIQMLQSKASSFGLFSPLLSPFVSPDIFVYGYRLLPTWFNTARIRYRPYSYIGSHKLYYGKWRQVTRGAAATNTTSNIRYQRTTNAVPKPYPGDIKLKNITLTTQLYRHE
jgi:hypothetical protein